VLSLAIYPPALQPKNIGSVTILLPREFVKSILRCRIAPQWTEADFSRPDAPATHPKNRKIARNDLGGRQRGAWKDGKTSPPSVLYPCGLFGDAVRRIGALGVAGAALGSRDGVAGDEGKQARREVCNQPDSSHCRGFGAKTRAKLPF
jgi:hypothetical protein